MTNIYKTTIHARCPFAPIWDYYSVELSSGSFVKCEDFEADCDTVRGTEQSQEDLASSLHKAIRSRNVNLIFNLKLTGRHGSNCETVAKR